MANALYPKYKETLITGTNYVSLTTASTLKAVLVDLTKYTYTPATDDFYNKIIAVGGTVDARIGTAIAFTSKTGTLGVFNAATLDFGNTTGAAAGAVVVFNDTGTASTSILVAYIDTATGLPVTPNGGDIQIAWDTGANKIFAL